MAGKDILSKNSFPNKVWVTMLPEIIQTGGAKAYSVTRKYGSPITDTLVHYSMALNQTYTDLCKSGNQGHSIQLLRWSIGIHMYITSKQEQENSHYAKEST